MRGRDEPDGEDLTSPPHPRCGQLFRSGAEPAEGLPERVDRCEPAEALAGVDQALVAQELEGLADRDPAGRVGCGEGRLAGEEPAGRELALLHAPTQLVGDRSVADLTHLSYTCLQTTTKQGLPAWPPPPTFLPPPRPSASLTRSTDGSPTPHHPAPRPSAARSPSPRRSSSTTSATWARSSSGAAATSTSTPTGSPCRTRQRRWRCCSS